MPFVPLEDSEAAEISPRALPEADEESGGRRASSRFVPLEGARSRFVPLEEESGPPSAMPSGRTLALNNPVTAIGETAANIGTQMVALPVAGMFGLAEAAGKAMGLHDRDPAGAVEHMAQEMTYQPRGELGKQLTSLVMIPFEKLAEVGKAAGNKVLEVTGNPELATAVDSLIQVSPMLIGPGIKGVKAIRERAGAPGSNTAEARGVVSPAETDAAAITGREAAESGAGMAEAVRQAEPPHTADIAPRPLMEAATMESVPRPKAESIALAQQQAADGALEAIGKARNVDEALEAAGKAIELPEAAESPRITDAAVSRPLTFTTTEKGTPLITGNPDAVLAAQTELRRALGAGGLLRREADGGVSLMLSNRTDPALIEQTIAGFNARRSGLQEATPEGGGLTVEAAPTEGARTALPDITDSAAPIALRQNAGGNLVITGTSERSLPSTPPRIAPLPEEALQQGEMASHATWRPGENYTGFIRNSNTTEAPLTAVPKAKPITREEVLVPFMKAMDVPIYEGRVKGKKLGTYTPGKEAVRIKNKSDLEVAAHEMAHLLDDRIPAFRQAWALGPQRKLFAGELKSVSYDRKNVREGFAEFVRLYMTQPEAAAEKAPNFFRFFEDFTASHEYGPAIRQAQADMTAWFGQDALQRARSKIGARKPINEALDGLWDKFRQATVDDLHGVYRMERDLKASRIEPMGAYETSRLSRASASMADGAIRYGYPVKNPDGSFSYKGKGLEEILKPVAENLDDFLLYAVGQSARELMKQGREHLFTNAEIEAMRALHKPGFERAFLEYQRWNKGILDFAEAQGVINPQARAMWQRQSYLPFWRVEQPGEFKGGKPGDWSGIKALSGGTDNLRDILANMTGNAAMLIDKAVKNEARLKIADMADTERGGGRYMVKIPPESRPVKIDGQQVMDAILKTLGIDQKGSVSPQLRKAIARFEEQIRDGSFDFMLANQPPAGRNVVAVLRSGKAEWYEVADPILYRALNAIDRPAQNWLVKWLGLPKRIGQTTITATADFWTANIARDTLMGSVMSRAGFRPILDSLDGMRMRMTKDPVYKEWIANGGGLSSIYLDEARFRAKLEQFYNRQGIDYRTVLDAPEKLMGFIETLGDAFESSTRLGEYKRAIERGENPRHAAYLAREVSTDFAMKGDSKALGFMYDTVMFLRPAAVSFDRLARGLAHDRNKGAIAAKAASIALLSAGLYLLNRDDPRYADLPDWDRDTHWHFFIGDQHFRYPKIWEIGSLASLAERTTEKLLAQDPKGLGKDLARIISQTFNLNLMPQIIAPLYEQAANRNSFTKAPIETPGMENVQPFLRAKPGTSETMKALGMATRDLPEGLQLNPVRAEALLRGYLNTWAMYGLMLTDEAFFGDKQPEKRADELPVVRRFYAQEPTRHTKFESQFYDMLGEAKRLQGTLKELDRAGRPDLADEKEKSPLAGEAGPLARAAKTLGATNNEMQAIRRDASLTPADKRQKLDALTIERNALLKEAVTESKKAQAEQKRRGNDGYR